MPELPEVETTRSGIEPWCINQEIVDTQIWQPSLRWPVPEDIGERIHSKMIDLVQRRGKYLLIHCGDQCLLVHLGMSGSLRITDTNTPRRKHDHWQIVLTNDKALRYHDPRRFGALLITPGAELADHKLLAHLGPEPLADDFDGDHLFKASRGKTQAVKNFIMSSGVVVGVGNIYAAEALFLAGIRPSKAAGRLSRPTYNRLAAAIKLILSQAIQSGGTTLRDYVNGHGSPGYFSQQLNVYGKKGQGCGKCGHTIRSVQLGQRSSFFCPNCQR